MKYTLHKSGMRMPVHMLNRSGIVVATIYMERTPGDQYDKAEVLANAPELLREARALVAKLQTMAMHPSHYQPLIDAISRATGSAA